MNSSNNPNSLPRIIKSLIYIKAKNYKPNQFPLMDRQKDTQQLLKYIYEANRCLQQFAQTYGDKLYELCEDHQQSDGMVDMTQAFTLEQLMKRHTLEEETSAQQQVDKPGFFSQVQLVPVQQQIQQKILNFKLNYVTYKRKEQLFKKHRQLQQQKFTQRKRQFQTRLPNKVQSYRNIKGQFTLKRGDQSFTCPITGDDLEKLRPEMDLNDTIIANYLKYLQTEVFSEETERASFIYSSFFIEKLVGEMLREDMYNDLSRTWYERTMQKVAENYKNIKRWTRKVDIFQKQYLIVPINALKHWYCVIVVNPGAVLDPNSTKRPYIAYCDSMFQKRQIIVDVIRTYLQIELQDKKQIKMEINEQNFPCYQLLLPRQTNTHDCGMYMITYIEHLITNKHELQDLHIVKKREKLTLFPRSLIFSMRQRLKDLFISLIQTPDETTKKQILRKYKQQTQALIKQADDQNDYDRINFKQLKKYQSVNSHLLESTGYNINEMTEQEVQHAMKIKFYIDPEINYYEKDRGMMLMPMI